MSTLMRITKKLARNWKTVLLVVFIISAIGRESEITRLTDELAKSQTTVPAPEVITKEVEKEVVVEKEVEKKVEVVPQACKDLIALDDEIINKVAIYFDDISVSAQKGDLFTYIEDSTVAIEKLNKFITPNVDKRLNLKNNCLK